MQITANFSAREFLTGPNPPKWEDLGDAIQSQIIELAHVLQAIRDDAGKPICINSGLRSKAEYERLKKAGYNPSMTSDHFFAQEVNGYKLGVGAADIVCPSMNTVDFYNHVLKMKMEGKIKCGQLLLEKANSFWVHIANHYKNWLEGYERSQRSLNGCGYSLNNGKSFTWLEDGKFAPANLT